MWFCPQGVYNLFGNKRSAHIRQKNMSVCPLTLLCTSCRYYEKGKVKDRFMGEVSFGGWLEFFPSKEEQVLGIGG